MSRVERIRAALTTALQPDSLNVEDESHHHAGHAGAATGRGHFRVQIVSRAFEGLRPLERHRRIYESLGEMMQTDIHALAIEARTPAEVRDPSLRSG